MSGWWLISYLVLWALLLITLLALLVVLRQLGLIYLRARGGALNLDAGPPIGAPIRFADVDHRGNRVAVPNVGHSLNLLLFTSPWCAICKDSLRGLGSSIKHHNVAAVVIDAGEPEETEELLRLIDPRVPVVSSVERQRKLAVETIPYGIVTNGEGVVLAKAIVNNVEDLDNLLEHAETQLGARLQAVS